MIAIFLVLITLVIVFIVCFICGIVQYVKTPKPPHWMTYKEYCNYYQNKEWLIEDEEEEAIEDSPQYAFLESQYRQLQEIYSLLEEQLAETRDNKKRQTILSKMLTIDRQVYNTREKMKKLRDSG